MATTIPKTTGSPFVHGSKLHEAVCVDAYNSELKDADGFIGDKASKRAFTAILEKRRDQTREVAEDPLGDSPTEVLKKRTLEKALTEGDLEAASLVHGAIEEFAVELSSVANRFLKLKSWQDTEHIVVGGGFSSGKVGALAISRASVLLQAEHGHKLQLAPIRHHPDEAGLLGNLHVVPSWMFSAYDSMVAVDIGGSNIRVGVVALNRKQDPAFKSATVTSSELWRHAEESPDRNTCIERLGAMIEAQIAKAQHAGLHLAPLIGVGCPGMINKDGSIEKGGQNLPGNWESSRFNLPKVIKSMVPSIGPNETIVTVHNDAVVQGLSETPWMQGYRHWGVLTIGTGLGNARFTNRRGPERPQPEKKARKSLSATKGKKA